jgi:hypothetical protein
VTLAVGGSAGPAAAAAWTQLPSASPDPTRNTLTGTSAIPGGSTFWAVGWTSAGTLVERARASGLTAVASPSPGSSARLEAVSADSATDAWAVGSYTRGDGEPHALILHWNGGAWAVAASPDLPGGARNAFVDLKGVVALTKTSAWAVGYRTTHAGLDQTVAEHWNGRRWTVAPSQNPRDLVGDTYAALAAICRVPDSTRLWAVGSSGRFGRERPMVETWTGMTWEVVHVAVGALPKHGIGVELNGVAASKRFVLAVGDFNNFANGRTLPIALRRTSAGWAVAHPVRVVGAELMGVTHVPGTTVFWSGGEYINTSDRNQPFVERWNGAGWATNELSVGDPTMDEAGFDAIRATGSGAVLAVGGIGGLTLAEIRS